MSLDNIRVAVIGLGYVGLPLARLFSTKFKTVGFDMNQGRVDALMAGHDATLDDVGIHMYGSTDEGGSFYVKTNTANIDSDSIFHAGDLNWWHWLGDTPENNADAKRMAWREFKELDGLSVDVAMFPVDNRLEAAMEWGSIEFLRRVEVKKAFIPMHLNGPLWTPSVYFKALFGDVPVWEPQKEGDECTF